MARKTCDILRYEKRGKDFALVRIEADGRRSELVLTAANVVHLGMLAPDFSRRLLTNKVAEKSGALGTYVKDKMLSTNMRTLEALMRLLERRRWRLDSVMTEQRARLIAARLLEKADELARRPVPEPRRTPRPRHAAGQERS
jgi:hypothetical protein